MTKSDIAKLLKDSRIKAGFEAKEVAEKLIELGAIKSVKSFYNWESGRTQPDADTFMYLCNLYKIKNVLETFGYRGFDDVQEVSNAYEKADIKTKNIVRYTLDLPTLEKEKPKVKLAARGGYIELTEKEAKALAESAKNAPDESGNRDLF